MDFDIEVDEIQSPEAAHEELDRLRQALEEPAPDLAVAIEKVQDIDDDTDPNSVTMPFRDEDLAVTFGVGLLVGALKERAEMLREQE